MANKVIRFTLDEAGIDMAINALQDYRQWLVSGTKKLLEALAQEGMQIASVKFGEAQYDGMNDVECAIELGETSVAVLAVGESVLFIEFGTGIRYPDSHPEGAQNGMVHGGYGHGLGRLENGWRYTGFPGSNGEVITTGRHAGQVHTYGNPANACMYDTKKELETKFAEIARRCFV